MPTRRSRPSATSSEITVHRATAAAATPHAAGNPPRLARSEQVLFAEAVRRAEETRNAIEDSLVNFGRWILVNVFQDDAEAALSNRSDNAVWENLVARAGGPTLRLSYKMLYLALQIAANDKRIQDDAWRLLEPGRKELLLPLGEPALMRQAARHVTEMKLTQDATRAYVRNLRAERGERVEIRMTPARARKTVVRATEVFGDRQLQKSLAAQLLSMDRAEKQAVRGQLEQLQQIVGTLLRKL